MEYSQTLNPSTTTGRLRVAQGLVLLFHVTGFVGLAFSKNPEFYLRFTPLTLLLTAGLLAAFQPGRGAGFWRFCFAVMLIGVALLIGLYPRLLLDVIVPSFNSPLFDWLKKGGAQ